MFDPFFPAGELRYYWKSIYLSGLEEDVVETVARHVAARPSALSMAGLWTLGGALGRLDAGATATGSRDAPYLLEILANWADPADTDVNIAWAREFFETMKPHSTGKTNVKLPRPRRRSRVRTRRLRRKLAPVERDQEEVRPDEPVPFESEHRAASWGSTPRPDDRTPGRATKPKRSRGQIALT